MEFAQRPLFRIMANDPFRHNVPDSQGFAPPRYAHYALYADRIPTFQTWSTDLHQTPPDLAAAGFFYSGQADVVVCYRCGGSLKEWEANDIPIVEHARWFPRCEFIKAEKADMEAKSADPTALNMADSSGPCRTFCEHAYKSADPHRTDRLLRTPAALSVLQMGYSEELVTRAIHLLLSSDNESAQMSAVKLMEIILDMEENESESNNLESDPQQKQYLEDDINIIEDENEITRFEEHIFGKSENMAKTYHQCTEDPYTSSGPSMSVTSSECHQRAVNITDNFKFLSLQTPPASSPKATPPHPSQELRSEDMIQEIKALSEENRILRESSLCKVCLEQNCSVVFLPCGHLATCEKCSSVLRKCPLCRTHIHGTVRVFLA